MTDTDVLQTLQQNGSNGLLVTFIVALFRRWIVFGWQYDAMVVERDRYRAIVERTLETSEQAVALTKVVTNAA